MALKIVIDSPRGTRLGPHTQAAREDESGEVVRIGGHALREFVHEGRCPRCRARSVYHEDYDADFCPQCNAWLEAKCSDPTCVYCSWRPFIPMRTRRLARDWDERLRCR